MKKRRKLILILVIMLVFFAVVTTYRVVKRDIDTTQESININTSDKSSNNEQKISLQEINIIENLDITGRVTNLEVVKWHDAKIEIEEGKINFSVYLDNTKKDEKVEARTLKLNFIDKANEVVYTKEVQMKKLEDKYGYTKIETELEMEPIIVYNVEIIAIN